MMSRKRLYYAGVPKAPYDLVKELLVALGVITLLVLILSAVLSSPDEPSLTLQAIARDNPAIFVQTSLDELDGNSAVASYGPPYNNGTGSVQYIGPVSLQKAVGVHIPVDTARDYVLGPLGQMGATSPQLRQAVAAYNQAPSAQQTKWTDAYNKALTTAKETPPALGVAPCVCGPVPTMMGGMLRLGQSGALDGLLLAGNHFYQTDYTRPLLFMQNDAVTQHAQKFNLIGSDWGVMNETGNYPGQAWLWLYTMLYQIAPYNTAWAANTDALVLLTLTLLTLILMFIPWIPGLNRLPRLLRVYRLIWKDYYRAQQAVADAPRGVE